MRVPRIYHPVPISTHSIIKLENDAAHHVAHVLRMQPGQNITLFHDDNRIFSAKITAISKKQVEVCTDAPILDNKESPLEIHLGQVISRGDKMDFTIQKSIELGVSSITPLLSERCGVKLEQERLNKKVQQWQKIAIAACEQCGRNQVPVIHPVISLNKWQQTLANDVTKLLLSPHASKGISQLALTEKKFYLLIGSEGGLSEQEINDCIKTGFTEVLLGPRILRTETAALTAITALQVCFGDLG